MGLGYMTPCTPNSPPSKSSTLAYYRPNVEGERIGKLLTHQGFLYASPCWSRSEPCSAQKQGKVFAVGNGSQLRQGRQKIFAKGRVGIPILSETLAEGQRPQAHAQPRLRQRQSLQPLTFHGSRTLGREQVIHSPTFHLGLPVSEMTALHYERPQPHLPHFLLLSHPLLRTLDFGTSCPRSWPLTCLPNLRVRLGKKGGCVARADHRRSLY